MLYIKQTNRKEKLTRVLGSFCRVIDPWSCSQHTHIRTKQTRTLIRTCLRVTTVIDLRADPDVDTHSRFSETSAAAHTVLSLTRKGTRAWHLFPSAR